MATAYARYHDGISTYLIPATHPLQNPRQTVYRPAVTPLTNIRTAFQDPTNVPRDLPTEEALRLEIEKLGAATLTIDKAFYDIGGRLSEVSKEQNKHIDLHDTCCTLEAQWKEHHRTYQQLLWRSRKLAGEAQAVVDEFREIILPLLRDMNIDREEKQDIIQEQILALERESGPSQQICQDFLDFSDTLDKYVKEFSRVVEGLGIGLQSQKIGDLKERLSGAKFDMEVMSREVKELGWKFASDISIVGITLLLVYVLPSLCERFAEVGVITDAAITVDYTNVKYSGIKLFETWGRYHLAVAKYDTIKAEYDLERACLSQMEKLDSTLQDAIPLVQKVTTKLGIFATVWAAITADIRQVQSWLGRTADPSSKLFIHRVQKLEKLYGYLSQALRLYQVTVRLPNKTD